jgi:hypothetical protein
VSERTPHEAALAWRRRVEGGCGGRAEAVGNGVSSRRRGDISGVCHCERRGAGLWEQAGFCLCLYVETGTLAEQRCKVFGCCHRRPHVWDLNGGVVGFVVGVDSLQRKSF